jgi:hypothetical protein
MTRVFAESDVPVVVSGGREGQPPREFQELPPGAMSRVVYGLNGATDCCFTVAVLHSADHIRATSSVCTARD